MFMVSRTLPLRKWQALLGISMFLCLFVLVGCGATSSSAGAGGYAGYASAAKHSVSSQPQSQNQQTSNATNGPQYLVKTLKVSMAVKDTRKVASDLQAWITTADPRSSSAGIDYELTNDNLYNVSLSFSVQSTLYPQIERYLRDYASQHGGQLLSLNESVQDVSNDYIDTQSRLTNLRGEQTRLLDLLSHAQALGDIISIQDKLTDVEGQIETIEAHLQALQGEVSYYTVSIALQPVPSTAPAPTNSSGWSIGQTFHDAFAASLSFAQAIITFLIWLLAYLIYAIPVALLAWFGYRWHIRSSALRAPKS